MRLSDEPGCDYWYLPTCAPGKSHAPNLETKRRTANQIVENHFVDCQHCECVGLLNPDGTVRWEQPGLYPD